MISKTSTDYAPWYIIPADYKWAARTLVSDIIATKIESLPLSYPKVSDEQMELIDKARDQLMHE